jgi:[protein-PII] uridylyltransferase
MQIDREKILIHADEKLAITGSAAERQDQVAMFRKFLKIETERLRIRHRFGLGGGEVMSGRSYLVDLIICRACQWAASQLTSSLDIENRCALIALGGYGRRELAPFSDVDILFLYAGRRSDGVKEFVELVLYLLWDIGLTVGHSFRSVKDCLAMAREDLPSRNAMAEARLITGNVHLFRRFTKELDDAVFKSKRETDAFLHAMRLEMEARYEKFGRAVCLQEPNLKESAGGLRDLHTVLWVGHARYGLSGLDDLRAADHITGAEYASARRAHDFIARVRNEAHFSTGRKTDLLTLDLQPMLASNLGYKPKRDLLASELFMREYYQRAHELHQCCESFLARTMGSAAAARRFGRRAKRVSDSAGFEIKQGKLYLKQRAGDLARNSMALIDVFSLAQTERVDLSDELKLAIRTQLSLIDRRFRTSPEASRAFIEILQRRGRVASTLRLMHETGFLGRLLPEFARITFLVQHDFYHKYTIDEHTLKAVEALDAVAEGHDPKLTRLGKVFAEIQDAAPVYLGLFLHDIGKGHGGGHVRRGVHIAERVCERLGLIGPSAQEVVFLVQYHLLMSHLSQRRDLSEQGLIEEFAATVGNLQRLNMLLLLTYADMSGVGPGVWNDWKGALLWDLYSRARLELTGGRPVQWDGSRGTLLKQKIILELLPEVLPSEVERHFALLPERYLRVTEPDQMVRHFRLMKLLSADSLITDWRTAADKHCTELTVCTRDSAGLFARIAGTLTAHGINILSADLYTREDGIVIDTFRICEVNSHHPVRTEQVPRIEQNLRAAIEGHYDIAAAVESWRTKAPRRLKRRNHIHVSPTVRFDSDSSATSTIIEVKAEDEPGLAYKIASLLAALGLNITFAKITTDKSHALDVFYVTDSAGQKLPPAGMLPVEHALLEALASRNQASETGGSSG